MVMTSGHVAVSYARAPRSRFRLEGELAAQKGRAVTIFCVEVYLSYFLNGAHTHRTADLGGIPSLRVAVPFQFFALLRLKTFRRPCL